MAKRSRTKKQLAPRVEPVESVDILEQATGTDVPHLQQRLMNQLYETLWTPDGLSDDERLARTGSAISLLQDIKPSGAIESMLATQMVATHHAAMDCFRRAIIRGQTVEGRDQNLKHAEKLLSIYSRQIEVLDKHRGKGQQKMTVEQVNVAAGGQAMVGNIETGKTEEVRRTGSEPEIKAITNNPGETIGMDLEVKQPELSRKY